MKHFINLKDIPAQDLRRILIDAKKRKKARKKLDDAILGYCDGDVINEMLEAFAIIDKVIKEIQPLMGDVLGNAMPDVTGPSLPIPSKPKLLP